MKALTVNVTRNETGAGVVVQVHAASPHLRRLAATCGEPSLEALLAPVEGGLAEEIVLAVARALNVPVRTF